jgi:large subunit ribosomal protein L2
MPVINRKPTTDGQRGMSFSDFAEITKTKPQKSLTRNLQKHAGRNNTGKITVAHRGGGSKRLYRQISFKRPLERSYEVEAIEYDPNRTANIALVKNDLGQKEYILATSKMKPGLKIANSEGSIKDGSQVKLKDIPTATFIHNIELTPGKGGQMCRSAGAYASFLGLDGKYALVKLPSGETRKILGECTACVGIVGNIDHSKIKIGKAGRTRHMGIRPTVRGKAKNPVDHPHGGGEGNTSIGLKSPKTPWGVPALGYKTRNKKNTSSKYIIKSRTKGKH